jgi:hypothetical protein
MKSYSSASALYKKRLPISAMYDVTPKENYLA